MARKSNSMKLQKKLSGTGFYLFLIPLFFVFHGALENFGFITFRDCFIVLISYFVAATILWLLAWFFFRNPLKACLLAAFLLSYYLFFGAFADFFKAHAHFLSRYVVLLPLSFITVCTLIIWLKKTHNPLYKWTFFLNGLLIIYLLIDIVGFIWKSLHPDENKLAVYGANTMYNYTACDNCPNPDIYFLLYDEYASTVTLKETYHYDNSALDSFLLQKGFSLQRHSHSNYNITPFSMASMLNMNYLSNVKNLDTCSLADFAKCNNLIRNNEVIQFLSARKYEIVNYSIFDLAGNPAMVESNRLPVKTRLFTDQTLYHRLMHDIGWNLYVGTFEIKWLTKNQIYSDLYIINKFLADVKEESRKKSDHPRFIYAHLSMPHYPYYYDDHFKLRDEKDLVADMDANHVISYTNYLPYVNKTIRELIDTIQKNTNRSAVIILMGDHGYRSKTKDGDLTHLFKNLNAVYFPDANYRLMTDSIIAVNQFRSIFNSLFKQQFPLLKDSTVCLIPRQ